MSTAIFSVQEHVLPTTHIREYPRATVEDQEDVLHLAIKQYTPKDVFKAKQEVTVIGAHANAFPKEMYEPLWDELYLRLKAKGIRIRSVWIADAAHQGGSGVLNEHKLGNDPSWMDHPRDLFLMVNHFRQHMKRPLIGIGHSMGGNNLVNLSLMHPRLFTTLVLIDPVIQRFISYQGNYTPASASARRRDRWSSRKTAETSFKKSKFYQAWDPRVLEKWIQFGLRELPTAVYPETTAASTTPPGLTTDSSTAYIPPEPTTEREVTLTTTKHQEVFTFLRPNFATPEYPFPSTEPNPTTHPDVDFSAQPVVPFYVPALSATFPRLQNLRPSAFYIYGELSNLSHPVLRADREANTGTGVGGSGGAKKGRVSQHVLKGVGHLIPMEAVVDTADVATAWIVPELERWRAIEDEQAREWATVPRERKAVLSEGYRTMVNSDMARVAAEEEEKRRTTAKAKL